MPSKAPVATLQSAHQFVEWIVLSALLLCGAVICVNAAWSEQRLAESTEALRMAAQERIVSEQLRRQMTVFRTALEHVRDTLPDEMPACIAGCDGAALQKFRNALPGVPSLLVLGRDGRVLARDPGEGTLHLDSAAWARWLGTMRDPGDLYLADPPAAMLEPGREVALVLPASEGRAVVALLKRAFLSDALESALYAPDMQGTLRDGDGRRIVNAASAAPALPTPAVNPGLVRQTAHDGLTGIAYVRPASKKGERLVVQRSLPAADTGLDRPLVVEVSRNVDDLSRPAWHLIVVYGMAWLVLALASVAVLLTIQHRRRALQRAVERHDLERAADAERIDMALDGGGLGLWEWDLVSGLLHVDARAAAMTGRTLDQIDGRADWILEVHPDDRALVKERLARYLDGQAVAFEVEYRQRHANGGWLWLYSRGKVVESDAHGKPLRIVGTRQDIGSRKQAEVDIHHLAFYDNLTDLPNRRLLLDRLEHALVKGIRLGRAGAVLFVDLDNFKNLNDTLGHVMGDRMLQEVAHRLRSVVRESDTVARFGGDEFVILLEDLEDFTRKPDERAGVVADKILGALSSPHFLDGHEVHITPSIGITLFGEQERSADELLRQADLAMYDAKSAGRNTYRFFAPVLQLTLDEQAKIEADLRHAVRRNELLLYFQPVVDDAGRTICLEALLRWNHPERGLLGPGQFIPVAEKSGLILSIGRWVLERACQQLAAWSGVPEGEGIKVAVNVSARQFRQDDFVEQVEHALHSSGADPHRLKLELTESIVLHDVEEVISKMSLLKARGVCFALDDFGTGYSSLSYLQRLPLDELKIDKSFVQDMLASQNAAKIVNAIVGLAASLGMDVVAEGVETESQRHFLAICGCLRYQGYLIAKPLPVEMVSHAWIGSTA